MAIIKGINGGVIYAWDDSHKRWLECWEMELELFNLARGVQTLIHDWIRDGKFADVGDAEHFRKGDECCKLLPRLFGFENENVFRDNLRDDMRATFEALLSPHGWAIYKMLEARTKSNV